MPGRVFGCGLKFSLSAPPRENRPCGARRRPGPGTPGREYSVLRQLCRQFPPGNPAGWAKSPVPGTAGLWAGWENMCPADGTACGRRQSIRRSPGFRSRRFPRCRCGECAPTLQKPHSCRVRDGHCRKWHCRSLCQCRSQRKGPGRGCPNPACRRKTAGSHPVQSRREHGPGAPGPRRRGRLSREHWAPAKHGAGSCPAWRESQSSLPLAVPLLRAVRNSPG